MSESATKLYALSLPLLKIFFIIFKNNVFDADNTIENVTDLDPSVLVRLHTLELRGNKLTSTAGINLPNLKNLFLVCTHASLSCSIVWRVKLESQYFIYNANFPDFLQFLFNSFMTFWQIEIQN